MISDIYKHVFGDCTNPWEEYEEKLRTECYNKCRYLYTMFKELSYSYDLSKMYQPDMHFEISSDYAKAMTRGFPPSDLTTMMGIPVKVTTDKVKSVNLYINLENIPRKK